MPKIFISYRRMDSQERAHRIADWLVLKYGLENVFIDVDRLGAGVDFRADIEKSLNESDVLLVVIGEKWVDELLRRMEGNEVDLVYFEVRRGLQNVSLVIPVLLDDDVRIETDRLPQDIQALTGRNYRYVRISDFHRDMERLKSEIDENFPIIPKKAQNWNFLTISGLSFIVLIIASFLIFNLGQGFLSQLSYTASPSNIETRAALTVAASAQPLPSETPNEQASLDAQVAILIRTAEAAYTATESPTATVRNTATATEDQTATEIARLAPIYALETQNAQATENAPTNTIEPSATYTASRTATATPNATETAQVLANRTATRNAFSTSVFVTAVALETANANATRIVSNNRATATQRAVNTGISQTETQAILNTAQAETCTDTIGCVEIAIGESIVLGTLLSTSGPFSALGLDAIRGVDLAIGFRDGALLEREIELINEDSPCSIEDAVASTQRLVSDTRVLGIIGASCSGEAVGAIPIISEAGFLMISPIANSERLTNSDPQGNEVWQAGFYRSVPHQLQYGIIAAEFAYEELGARSVSTIYYDDNSYSENLAITMREHFIELGGEVRTEHIVNYGDTDMRDILNEIAANPPDVLYFPMFETESVYLVTQARNIPALRDTILMTADANFASSFPNNLGDLAEGIYISAPSMRQSAEYEAFLEVWNDEFNTQPLSVFHATAFDATNMLLDAIEAVAVERSDGTLLIGRQALRDYLNNLEGYQGLTGTLSCSPTGDCGSVESLGIFQITEAEIDGNWPPPVIWQPQGE